MKIILLRYRSYFLHYFKSQGNNPVDLVLKATNHFQVYLFVKRHIRTELSQGTVHSRTQRSTTSTTTRVERKTSLQALKLQQNQAQDGRPSALIGWVKK